MRPSGSTVGPSGQPSPSATSSTCIPDHSPCPNLTGVSSRDPAQRAAYASAEQVAGGAHENPCTDRNEVVGKIIVRVVQAGVALAGAEEQHRRLAGAAEAPSPCGQTSPAAAEAK